MSNRITLYGTLLYVDPTAISSTDSEYHCVFHAWSENEEGSSSKKMLEAMIPDKVNQNGLLIDETCTGHDYIIELDKQVTDELGEASLYDHPDEDGVDYFIAKIQVSGM